MTISASDLAITLAYFSIPFQICFGLCRFPRLTRRATKRVVILLVLFALFIFLCGFGHLLRCLDKGDTTFFRVVNILTAVISICTAAYLMPFVPNLLDGADKLYLEATASREIIRKLYPEQIRQRLLKRESAVQDEKSAVELLGRRRTAVGNRALMRQRIQDFVRRSRRVSNSSEARHDDDIGSSNEDSDDDEEENQNSPSSCMPSHPLADDFDQTSMLFADIANFTYWSSNHTPIEVFTLLESIFVEFDRIAKEMGVYKLSTVGDCYIAVTGVPCPCDDHAIILTQFAQQCLQKANEVLSRLNTDLHTTDLALRIGIHSGPVTAGVLRGDKARFDLFCDTINTAARIETTGEPNRIHLSEETARLMEEAGRGDWLVPRTDSVEAKGKGVLKTYWLKDCRDDVVVVDVV